MRMNRNLLLGTAALLTSTTLAFAQEEGMMPEQMTEEPTVAADTANHVAILEADEMAGDATGAAWLFVDPQNNTVNWTIEYTGFDPIAAEIVCGDDDTVAITLTEDEMESPIEGQAGVDQDAFTAIDNGECSVLLVGDEDGGELRGAITNAMMGEGGM